MMVAHALQLLGISKLVLLSLSDADSCFTLVDYGQCGRVSEAGVFQNSLIYNLLESNQLNFPEEYFKLIMSDDQIPFIIDGDEAFPLKMYLIMS